MRVLRRKSSIIRVCFNRNCDATATRPFWVLLKTGSPQTGRLSLHSAGFWDPEGRTLTKPHFPSGFEPGPRSWISSPRPQKRKKGVPPKLGIDAKACIYLHELQLKIGGSPRQVRSEDAQRPWGNKNWHPSSLVDFKGILLKNNKTEKGAPLSNRGPGNLNVSRLRCGPRCRALLPPPAPIVRPVACSLAAWAAGPTVQWQLHKGDGSWLLNQPEKKKGALEVCASQLGSRKLERDWLNISIWGLNMFSCEKQNLYSFAMWKPLIQS